jgi:hypothetical protein
MKRERLFHLNRWQLKCNSISGVKKNKSIIIAIELSLLDKRERPIIAE